MRFVASFMSNDTEEPPLQLSGRSNNITFVGKFHSAFRNYLEKNGLVTLDDFKHAEAIATIRGIEGTTPRLQDSESSCNVLCAV